MSGESQGWPHASGAMDHSIWTISRRELAHCSQAKECGSYHLKAYIFKAAARSAHRLHLCCKECSLSRNKV